MRQSPKRITIATLVAIITITTGFAAPGRPGPLGGAAERAISTDAAAAAAAIAELRAAGPAGFETLAEAHSAILARGAADPAWERLTRAMDAVAAQKDAYASRLYWFTDLERAKSAARASGRPIVSLRLLGNLDEDLSCANSRFFRTVLYANREVSRALRERFVLHWQSERPAPRITITFGDGRSLTTTITGNSIHYVLDSDGRPLDALPGLWSPTGFLAELARAEQLAQGLRTADPTRRGTLLASYHRGRAQALAKGTGEFEFLNEAPGVEPDAFAAGRLARSKMSVERPVLRNVVARKPDAAEPGSRLTVRPPFEPRSAGQLDASSRALMRTKLGRGDAVMKQDVEGRLAGMVAAFEGALGEDEALNRDVLHRRIHDWFARGEVTGTLETLNERVYRELFLTPASDPWLGLLAPDAYLGLDGNGVRQSTALAR